MTEPAIVLAGHRLLPLASGALYWPALRAILVADLHLEKGSSYARRDTYLPPYDSRATLAKLSRTIQKVRVETVVCLGDSFHDAGGPRRLPEAEARALVALARDRDWVWVTGNHDAALAGCPVGRVVPAWRVHGVVLRHEADARAGVDAEISGHLHPKASISLAGRRHTGKCFVTDRRRLILPAFGAYAGGLDVTDPAICRLLASRFDVYFIGARTVHVFPGAAARLNDRRRRSRLGAGTVEHTS
jgi:DNA ligase-associated metallophosphoesterase